MRRPIPLFWGLLAFTLFVGFVVVTKIQFDRIADDKIFEARMESYENSLKVYEAATQAHDTCVATIEVRETYRNLFNGIEEMFEKTANLPVDLLPESQVAVSYQQAMLNDIVMLITIPVEEGLPPRRVEDCPQLPTDIPERPGT
jgi:hypothetical protein